MIYIKANDIQFSYENQSENILENIFFEITNKSRIGLIGNNGCGKSTIIDLIKQKLKPLSGNFYFKKDLEIGVVDQEIKFNDQETISEFLWKFNPQLSELHYKMQNLELFTQSQILEILDQYEILGGYRSENKISEIIQRFGFTEDFINQKICNLSGGEKTKIALCKILLEETKFLLLDEPTNHLDLESIKWLENFLKTSNIPFLVVSHDREFLDNCVTEIWELNKKKLRRYSGNYSLYKREKDEELNLKIHQYEVHNKKIKKLKRAMIARKNWALDHQGQTGKEGYAPIYESVTNFSKTAMKKAKNLETRINKELEKEESQKPFIEKIRKIKVEDSGLKAKFILKVNGLHKSFGNRTILKGLTFDLKYEDKICLTGINGSGKTTLLKIITGKIKDFDGNIIWSPQVKIGYYSQEFENIDFDKTIIDEVANQDNELQTKARTILGCFNIRKDEVFKTIKNLSIGERSKVALSKIILAENNVLILDEPTNHLDISSMEALEEALENFKGPIIFVSHDRYFQNKIANRFLKLENGTFDS